MSWSIFIRYRWAGRACWFCLSLSRIFKACREQGSPPSDTGKHDYIAPTVGIQTWVDKGQSSRQLSVCKRIGDGGSAGSQTSSSSDLGVKGGGGGGACLGCKAIWEARRGHKLLGVLAATRWYPAFSPVATETHWPSHKQSVCTIDLLPAQHLLYHP